MASASFQKRFRLQHQKVEKALKKFLPSEKTKPGRIHQAMRYSMLAGGKRLRPILALAAAESCGKTSDGLLPGACALELIHTYSLIHDDLPAMDNDDLRRGRPTNHKVYGEDMAILAGDALLTEAFLLLSKSGRLLNLPTRSFSRAIEILSTRSGSRGMVGGQVADIQSDKGRWKEIGQNGLSDFKTPKALLSYIHENKTAALFMGSLELGACLAGASEQKQQDLARFGLHIGLAFQIRDDILDIVGDKKKLGKKGSDAINQKLTFPALYGLKASEKMAERHVREAKKILKKIKPKTSFLEDLAEFILKRDY